MMNEFIPDTIVALASGRGEAGVAVIRLSGSRCTEISRKIFKPRMAGNATHRRLILGTIVDGQGNAVDDCLIVSMAEPNTFTGEDVLEIQCHGSSAVVNKIIEICLEQGARLAEPGEFSKRAFLKGKMDLTQAEGLSDLISARSEASRSLALKQLRGGVSSTLKGVYSRLLDAAAELEAHIDFPEEDIPDLARGRIVGLMEDGRAEMQRLLEGHRRAKIQVDGARVVLVGAPNAGKSSLFNALLGRERAIVSPHPGTTRDTIETTLEIKGLAITLIDTAGIRDNAGEIEKIGIDRTHQEIEDADLVLLLRDGTDNATGAVSDFGSGRNIIQVVTKADLLPPRGSSTDTVFVSSSTGLGLDELEKRVCRELVGDTNAATEEALMSRVRQADSLQRAAASLDKATAALRADEPTDLVMVDLRDCLIYLGEIWGERLDEQILDRIFSTFCLGK